MAQGAWRPGMATSCANCGGHRLSFAVDGTATCAECGTKTPSIWQPFSGKGAATPTATTAVAPSPGPPTLRFMNPPPAAPTVAGQGTPPVVYARREPFTQPTWDLRLNRIVAGVILLGIGILVTVGTYDLAASTPGGGTYFIAFGPVLFGIYLIARGLTTPAGIPTYRRPRAPRAVAAPATVGSAPSSVTTTESSPAMTRGSKWPLLLFLVGLVLFLVGEAISLQSFAAAEIVGDTLGFPGFFLLIISPIWWVIARLRRNARRAHL